MKKHFLFYISIAILAALVVAITTVAWYSHTQQTKIAHNKECHRILSQHPTSTDGFTILPSCVFEIVPTSIWEMFIGTHSLQPSVTGCDQSATTTNCSKLVELYPSATTTPPGIVTTTTNGQMMYTNEALGLKFTFPLGWHLGVNTLGDDSGHGYLQLFNYDETKADGSVFPKGNNKIESVITDDNNIATSSDYAEQSRETTSVQIAGKTVAVVDVTLVGGQKYRAYIIPLQDQSSKFLRMIIYGDPDNFHILDNLVRTIEWLK